MAPHFEYCRSCMTENLVGGTNLADSYNAYCGEKIDLATMFHKTTNINPLEDDYSRNLCKACTDFLRIAFEFRRQCWLAQDILVGSHQPIHDTARSYRKSGIDQLQKRPMIKTKRLNTEVIESDVKLVDDSLILRVGKNENSFPNLRNTLGDTFDSFEDDNNAVMPGSLCDSNLNKDQEVVSVNDIPMVFVSSVTENEPIEDELVNEGIDSKSEPIKVNNQNQSIGVRVNNNLKFECHALGCKKAFPDVKERIQHVREMIAQGDDSHQYKCKECGVIEESLTKLNLHKKTQNTIKTCDICNESFSYSRYKVHKRNEHQEQKTLYNCMHCDKAIEGYHAYRAHTRYFHKDGMVFKNGIKDFYSKDNIINCGVFCPAYGCNMLFTTKQLVENHLEEMKDSPDHMASCDICNKNLSRRSLVNHMINMHISATCDDCSERLPSMFRLREHKRELHNKLLAPNLQFQCKFCNKVLAKKSSLRYHYNAYHSQSFICQICGEKQETAHLLKLHMYKHTRYVCSICNKKNRDNSTLQRHMEQNHSLEFKYSCEICGKMFYSDMGRKHHQTKHLKYEKHNCELCGEAFKTIKDVFYHKKKIHQGLKPEIQEVENIVTKDFYSSSSGITAGIFCPSYGCNKLFNSKKTLFAHLFEMRDDPSHQYRCELCDKRFSSNCIRQHMEKYHISCSCELCSTQLPSQVLLIKHKQEEHNEGKIKCPQCDKMFNTLPGLSMHINVFHIERNSQTYSCEICGSAWASQQRLERHLYSHQQYKCDICGEERSAKSLMERHVSTHLKTKPFKCEKCPKSFKSQSRLKCHEKFHLETLNCSCEICGKSFKHRSILKSHLKTHVPIQECDICSEKFKTVFLLEIHKKEQHNIEARYTCQYCGRIGSSKKNLDAHINSVHEKKLKFKCTDENCEMAFTNAASRTYHVRKCHLGVSVKNISYQMQKQSNRRVYCTYEGCRKEFLWKSHLEKHVHVAHLGFTNREYINKVKAEKNRVVYKALLKRK